MKYVKVFLQHFSKYPVFTYNDVRLLMKDVGNASESYIKFFVHSMLKTGRIFRVTKGYYATWKDISVVGFAFKPYYYGLGYALTYHRVWNQQANLTVITTKIVAEGARTVFGNNIILRRIPKELFFGYFSVQAGKYSVHVSDLEKTLIDIVYFRNNYADYVLKEISKRVDRRKVKRYLDNYDDAVRKRVNTLLNQGPAAYRRLKGE